MGEIVTRKYTCDWCGAKHEAQDAPGINPDQAMRPWNWGGIEVDTSALVQPDPGTRSSKTELEVIRGRFFSDRRAGPHPDVVSEILCDVCIDVIVQNVEDAKRQCKARNK